METGRLIATLSSFHCGIEIWMVAEFPEFIEL
jgi:hypothetical protein